MAKERYDHARIEAEAQAAWGAQDLYRADLDTDKERAYVLFEFPFPSGDLHIGHWYAFALTDVYARYLRMLGKEVLFPMGFDSFGLPAENAAIKRGVPVAAWIDESIDTMRAQVRSMGTSVDWSKEVVTSSPAYYRWTQWLFAKLFEHGIAYRKEAPVKWCPVDKTVLANEQVIDGHCERCGSPVEEKRLTQWFMDIRRYADRLLADLDTLPWPEPIKDAQRAWIGKSEGARLPFTLRFDDDAKNEWKDEDENPARIWVFTTRPDTVFGATYVVLAPEHPWVAEALAEDAIQNGDAVRAYREKTARRSERERMEGKEKTGVRLEGVQAVNPATGEPIPVFVADYVLAGYGTGAVMAVPAHDERDYAFAQAFGLPIKRVVDPVTGDAQEDPLHKDKIVAVVERADGQVLSINWKPELGGRLLVGGTVEPDEDPAMTAAREIAEETGYTDLELAGHAEEQVHHGYFAFSKNQATVAHTTLLHFRLKSDACDPQKLEDNEQDKFEVEWVPLERAKREIHDDQHLYALARFLEPGAYAGDGILRDSGAFTGRDNRDAMADIVAACGGEAVTNFRMRDWLVSRQRYWGCPIPIVYDPDGNPHAVPAEHLPWILPSDVGSGDGDGAPLAASAELKERTERIFGKGWAPETDTLDVFVDSSWYFLRYLDPDDDGRFSDPARMERWLPVDRYSGGNEHTTVHLLYSRFFHKALYDLALVPTPEPYRERFNRGLILDAEGRKMSKRWGNVVNPDEMVAKHGADAVRLYLGFIGPYNEAGAYPFSLDGVHAMRRFLDRVNALCRKRGDAPLLPETERALAKAAFKVGSDIERFKYNTAISALMVLVRELEALPELPAAAHGMLLRLLAPFAPHLAEHLWSAAGNAGSVHAAPWPEGDDTLDETVSVAVQVNGKTRGTVTLAPDAPEADAFAAARALPAVEKALGGAEPARTVYVPGRILNLVITPV